MPLQRALLASALDAVRPGGVVAYVTCSPHLAETPGVVDAVLGRRGTTYAWRTRGAAARACPDAPGRARHVQLWPHRHGTDAMFLALLRRR